MLENTSNDRPIPTIVRVVLIIHLVTFCGARKYEVVLDEFRHSSNCTWIIVSAIDSNMLRFLIESNTPKPVINKNSRKTNFITYRLS